MKFSELPKNIQKDFIESTAALIAIAVLIVLFFFHKDDSVRMKNAPSTYQGCEFICDPLGVADYQPPTGTEFGTCRCAPPSAERR